MPLNDIKGPSDGHPHAIVMTSDPEARRKPDGTGYFEPIYKNREIYRPGKPSTQYIIPITAFNYRQRRKMRRLQEREGIDTTTSKMVQPEATKTKTEHKSTYQDSLSAAHKAKLLDEINIRLEHTLSPPKGVSQSGIGHDLLAPWQ